MVLTPGNHNPGGLSSARNEIPVHWLSGGGYYVADVAHCGSTSSRQYEALSKPELCLHLVRKLTLAKVEGLLRYLLRASRISTGIHWNFRIGQDTQGVPQGTSIRITLIQSRAY